MARKSSRFLKKTSSSCPSANNDVSVQNENTDTSSKPESSSSSDSESDIVALVDQTLSKMSTNVSPTPESELPDSNAFSFTIDKTPSNRRTLLEAEGKSDSGDSSDSDFEFDEDYSEPNIDKGNNRKPKVDQKFALSSSLDPGEEVDDTYINVNAFKAPERKNDKIQKLLLKQGDKNDIMKKSVIAEGVEKKFTLPEYEQSLHQQRKERKAARERTKGKKWFDMKAPEMTAEKKNDLTVLQMRHVLDPKRFYKAPDIRALPKYFEMGTIQENATDFYSGRIPKKERKKTLVDELLEDSQFRKYNKRKYTEIQEAKMKSTGPYKRMKRLKKKKK